MWDFIKNNSRTITVLVIMLLVYYAAISWNNSRIYDDILTGFWQCSADFLRDSGLSSFLLYLAPPKWNGVRPCYILAECGSDLVINEPASVSLTQTWGAENWSLGFGSRTYAAIFTDLETQEFPHTQTLVLHPKSGKIILSKDDTVYAVMYKDCASTETMYMLPQNVGDADMNTHSNDVENVNSNDVETLT